MVKSVVRAVGIGSARHGGAEKPPAE